MKKIFLGALLFLSINVFGQNDEDRWVDSVFNSLTLEQKVGQLVNLRANQPRQNFDPKIEEYINKYRMENSSPMQAAYKGLVDDVIPSSQTRARIISALYLLD